MSRPGMIPLPDHRRYSQEEQIERAKAFYSLMNQRRSVRSFDTKPVPQEVIESCIRTAGTAPSGANQQPWHFEVVQDPQIRREIRLAAEEVEREFYTSRAPEAWLKAIEHLGTHASKPFLEEAPVLIVIFEIIHGKGQDGETIKHYYTKESTGIATGFLIASLHNAGLACLTHTPSPMGFLNRILNRPDNERPLMVLVTGYPAPDTHVPDISRKSLEEIATFR